MSSIDTKTLESGEEIAVWHTGQHVARRWTIETVEAVSPAGEVVLDDGRRFDARGETMGGDRSPYGCDGIHELTDDLRKFIADEPNLRVIEGVLNGWGRLSTESLAQIAGIIESDTARETVVIETGMDAGA
jgi:hypothetical protein